MLGGLAARCQGHGRCKMSTAERSLIPHDLCRECYNGGNNLESITHVETAAASVATALA